MTQVIYTHLASSDQVQHSGYLPTLACKYLKGSTQLWSLPLQRKGNQSISHYLSTILLPCRDLKTRWADCPQNQRKLAFAVPCLLDPVIKDQIWEKVRCFIFLSLWPHVHEQPLEIWQTEKGICSQSAMDKYINKIQWVLICLHLSAKCCN